MILIDANLLIYAYNIRSPQHAAARSWLEDMLSSDESVGLPWAVIHAFLRITTRPPALPQPLTMEYSTSVVSEWLDTPSVHVLEAGTHYWKILRGILLDTPVRGDRVSDAHLAAIVIEHDATLYTTDRDFQRFAGLRVVNPLV